MGFTFFWNRKKKKDWQPAATDKLPVAEASQGSIELSSSSLEVLQKHDLLRQMKAHHKELDHALYHTAVPPDKAFLLSDGKVLLSLAEFESALRTMSLDVYNHHVHEGKNDFANWVYDVLGFKALSVELRRHRTREQTLQALERLQ